MHERKGVWWNEPTFAPIALTKRDCSRDTPSGIRGRGGDRGEPYGGDADDDDDDDGDDNMADVDVGAIAADIAVLAAVAAAVLAAEICRRNPTTSLTSQTVRLAALGRAYLEIEVLGVLGELEEEISRAYLEAEGVLGVL